VLAPVLAQALQQHARRGGSQSPPRAHGRRVLPLRRAVRRVFFFNDPPAPEIYTLSLHDALPISPSTSAFPQHRGRCLGRDRRDLDRKSTRLNSSHVKISYAVFCLKKKTTMPAPLSKASSAGRIPCTSLIAKTAEYAEGSISTTPG